MIIITWFPSAIQNQASSSIDAMANLTTAGCLPLLFCFLVESKQSQQKLPLACQFESLDVL